MTLCGNCNGLLTKASFRVAYDITASGFLKKIEFVHAACNKARLPHAGYWSDLEALYLKPSSITVKALLFNAIQAFGGKIAA